MGFRDDERGQPVLVGALLLFAILVVAFAGYQAFVVPSQNAEVEFDHAATVQTQFSELQSNVVNAVESGDERSTSVTLGTGYPARLLALNPSPASGSLETSPRGEVAIDAGGEDIAADVCGEAADGTFSRSLVYSPGYNEYRNAGPTTYEHTFVSREFRDGGGVYGDQRFVGTDRIDLLLVTGSVSENGRTGISVDVDATHRHRYGEVEDPTVTIPSQFDAAVWDDEILDGVDGVENVADAGDGRVEIELEGEFQLSCAVAGLNGDPAFEPPRDGADPPVFDTRWVAADGEPIEGGTVTTSDETVELTMEATDAEDGSPIAEAEVDFSIEGDQDVGALEWPGGGSDTGPPGTHNVTDDDGRASVEVEVDGEDGDRFRVYVTAGDDGDVLTVEVGE